MAMQEKKIVLQSRSSLATPLQADTIFGHFCWAIKYIKGENFLSEFLENYIPDGKPPLIFSDGFPDGYLPRPVLPPIVNTEELAEIGRSIKSLSESDKISDTASEQDYDPALRAIQLLSMFARWKILPLNSYKRMANGLDMSSAIIELFSSIQELEKVESVDTQRVHNTVNRYTFSSLQEGGLYAIRETFYQKDQKLAVYAKYDDESGFEPGKLLEEFFNFLCDYGFGRKKSTGKGSLYLSNIENSDLPHTDNPNAVMSLSNFVPDPSLPVEEKNCYYDLFTKYGRLGGEWSVMPKVPKHSPFKKPVVMMVPGSIFQIQGKPADFYGVMLKGVHNTRKEVMQHAYLFPLYIKLNKNTS